jgi:hypothetical protein
LNRRPDDYKSTALPTELHRLAFAVKSFTAANENTTKTENFSQAVDEFFLNCLTVKIFVDDCFAKRLR